MKEQPNRPPDVPVSPSAHKIIDIEHKYTGPSGDPKTPVSSADVAAAIAALDEQHGPDIAGRNALAQSSLTAVTPSRWAPTSCGRPTRQR